MGEKTFTYGSICSGLEMAYQALEPLGFDCQFVAEIEAFPCGIMGHRIGATRPRYPLDPETLPTEKERKHWRANNRELERMVARGGAFGNRIINFGDFTKPTIDDFPNLDLLIGGPPCQAFSNAGKRGGLEDHRGSLTLAYVDLVHALFAAKSLRAAVYENVPGLLSDEGNAFGCFLGALVGGDDALHPPGGGSWTSVGMASGPRARVAWRILDAQHFRLAQRRRRLFVVVCPRDGADPARILFEPQGLRRPTAPRREASKDVAGTVSGGARGSGGYSLDDVPLTVVDTAPTIRAGGNQTGGHRPPGTDVDTIDSLLPIAFNSREELVSSTKVFGALGSSRPQAQAVAYSIMPMNSGKDFVARVTDIAQPVMAGGPVGGNQGGDYIVEPLPFDTTQMTSAANRSNPRPGDPRHPVVAAGHPPAVAFSIRGRDGGAQIEPELGDVAPAVRTGNGGSSKSFVATLGGAIRWAVRRLMPTECEALQGSARDWTKIPWRGKPAEQCPDGPRYKAIGNSFPGPVIVWLGRRVIAEFERVDALKAAA